MGGVGDNSRGTQGLPQGCRAAHVCRGFLCSRTRQTASYAAASYSGLLAESEGADSCPVPSATSWGSQAGWDPSASGRQDGGIWAYGGSLIIVKCTSHEIRRLNHFTGYSLVALSTSSLVCSCCSRPFAELRLYPLYCRSVEAILCVCTCVCVHDIPSCMYVCMLARMCVCRGQRTIFSVYSIMLLYSLKRFSFIGFGYLCVCVPLCVGM